MVTRTLAAIQKTRFFADQLIDEKLGPLRLIAKTILILIITNLFIDLLNVTFYLDRLLSDSFSLVSSTFCKSSMFCKRYRNFAECLFN